MGDLKLGARDVHARDARRDAGHGVVAVCVRRRGDAADDHRQVGEGRVVGRIVLVVAVLVLEGEARHVAADHMEVLRERLLRLGVLARDRDVLAGDLDAVLRGFDGDVPALHRKGRDELVVPARVRRGRAVGDVEVRRVDLLLDGRVDDRRRRPSP